MPKKLNKTIEALLAREIGSVNRGRDLLVYLVLPLSAPERLAEKIYTRPDRLKGEAKRLKKILLQEGLGINFGVADLRERLRAFQVGRRQFYPWGCGFDKNENCVIFDRDYRPLFSLSLSRPPAIMNPGIVVPLTALRFFYEDATAPHIDPDTMKTINMIADACDLQSEIANRIQLSDCGRIFDRVWFKNWAPL
jgi:hypothetical protein